MSQLPLGNSQTAFSYSRFQKYLQKEGYLQIFPQNFEQEIQILFKISSNPLEIPVFFGTHFVKRLQNANILEILGNVVE